jgi:ABC-type glutathione transport system ATPase component
MLIQLTCFLVVVSGSGKSTVFEALRKIQSFRLGESKLEISYKFCPFYNKPSELNCGKLSSKISI